MTEATLISLIYDGVLTEGPWAGALEVLAAEFGCVASTLFYVDRARPEADIALGYGLFDHAAQDRYLREFAHLDPVPAAMANLRPGTALSTDEVFAGRLHYYSAFLEGFYYPLGLAAALGGPVATVGNGRFGIVLVNRGLARQPFTGTDISRFEALMPHFGRALELRRAFFSLTNQVEGLGDAVETSTAGLLTLDGGGRLVHANAAARGILARADGLRLTRDGRLRADHGETDAQILRFFQQEKPGSLVVRMPRPMPSSYYAIRIRTRTRKEGEEGQSAGFAVYLSDSAGGASSDLASLLASLFRMPSASAKLAAALVEGTSLASYGEQRRLSASTVKFHLKAAFNATQTRRQADLVRVCATVARDLSG